MDLKAPVWSNTVSNTMFDTLMISLQKMSIHELTTETIEWYLYPNPSSDFVHIKLDAILPNQDLMIANELGAIVFEQKNMQEDLLTIPVNHFKTGIYFIHISSKNKILKTARLLVR